jgi:hypothetical protein
MTARLTAFAGVVAPLTASLLIVAPPAWATITPRDITVIESPGGGGVFRIRVTNNAASPVSCSFLVTLPLDPNYHRRIRTVTQGEVQPGQSRSADLRLVVGQDVASLPVKVTYEYDCGWGYFEPAPHPAYILP